MPTNMRHQRARAALQTFFVGDALSMPVHWYYNPIDIQRAFPGGVKEMHAAPTFHPSSIMSLHSTSKGGRGKQEPSAREIVGDIILKGKRQYWGIANQHYHQGLPAGENTLNAYCARLLIRGVSDRQNYNAEQFLQDYIAFMQADPPQHPDTYAESYHRGFFANLESGKPIDKCGAITHDTPSIGGLVTIVPLALFSLLRNEPLAEVQALCQRHLYLTHPDESLARVCNALVELIDNLLNRSETENAEPLLLKASKCIANTKLDALLKRDPGDLHVIGRHFSSACYITDSWPSMLYLAAKYQPTTEVALIANTNAGGENAHRGAVLGSVMGLIAGSAPTDLYKQLLHKDAITNEIDQLIAATL